MRFAVILRREFMAIAVDEVLRTIVTVELGPDHTLAVERLYHDRGRELWAFGRRLGLEPEECDDAVQEAHLRLWTALSGGSNIGDPAAWLYRVFYRLAMDRHRLSRRVHELVRRWPGRDDPRPADDTDHLSIWAAVDRLPARQRAAVYLHYRADMTFDRVALVMGITPGAARSYASRGIEAVRQDFRTIDEADR
jgi:RNA polymerase sigma-70 factor, ECF subfamily